MFRDHAMGSTTRFAFVLTTTFASVLLLSAANASAQDPQDQDQDPRQGQQSQESGVQPAPMPPGQQDGADSRPVTSRDTFPQDHQQAPGPAQRPPSPNRPAMRPAAPAPVPTSLTIPS